MELFTGLGGLAKGLENAGFSPVKFIEFNKDACNSLRANYDPSLVYEGDVRNFDASEFIGIDLVAGGPPCQPFSLGGLGKAHNDERDMFPETARIVGECQPKAFIFENVKGLLRKSFEEYFHYIILRLQYPLEKIRSGETWTEHKKRLSKIDPNVYKKLSYVVEYKLLNAADYGVPQKRERVFIVGVRKDLQKRWKFPQPTHSDIYTQQTNLFDGVKPWVTLRELLKGIPEPTEKGTFAPDHIFRPGAKVYKGHTGSALDQPSKTIKAGGHGVPGGENMIRFDDGRVRYMSTYEAKLIQTFPSDYVVTGAWGESLRQIGNAVPVKLAEVIGKQMSSLLFQV